MARSNLDDSRLNDPVFVKGVKGGVGAQVLGGNITMPRNAPYMQFYDANGVARTITLPPPERGLTYLVTNTAAGAFGLVMSDPLGPTTRGTIAQGTAAFLYSDGVRWYYGPLT